MSSFNPPSPLPFFYSLSSLSSPFPFRLFSSSPSPVTPTASFSSSPSLSTVSSSSYLSSPSSPSSPLSSYNRPLPPSLYTNSDVFPVERCSIFSSNWLFYCLLTDFNDVESDKNDDNKNDKNANVIDANNAVTKSSHGNGNFVSRNILGYPLVVHKHFKSGKLIGFHNVCRHRGGTTGATS